MIFISFQQDTSCAVYLLEVDPKGHVLYWKPEDFTKVSQLFLYRFTHKGTYLIVSLDSWIGSGHNLQHLRLEDRVKVHTKFIYILYKLNSFFKYGCSVLLSNIVFKSNFG